MAERVLLLEDNADLSAALQTVLEVEGYEVSVTPSGTEALLRVAKSSFDVVIADLQVEDLSGLGVWNVMGDLASVPVIAISASEGPWQKQAFEAGVSACLAKPFGPDEVLSLITSMLRSRRREDDIPGDVRTLSHDDIRRIMALEEEHLARLPFGLIRIDKNGVICGFNAYEEEVSGRRASSVIGTKFRDLAPCTQVKLFTDAIEEAVGEHGSSPVLRFRFPHRGALAIVSIRLFYDEDFDQLWIFASKRLPEAREAKGA